MVFGNTDGTWMALGIVGSLAVAGTVLRGSAAREKVSIQVGDKVQYKAAFLRSIGVYTGDLPRAKGIVTEVSSYGVATMEWDLPGIPERVNVHNLKTVGSWEAN